MNPGGMGAGLFHHELLETPGARAAFSAGAACTPEDCALAPTVLLCLALAIGDAQRLGALDGDPRTQAGKGHA